MLQCIRLLVGEWYELGLELNVPEEALEAISCDHRGDVRTCKRKLVQEWISQCHPSWQSLKEALHRMKENTAAAQLSEKYSDGKSFLGIYSNAVLALLLLACPMSALSSHHCAFV